MSRLIALAVLAAARLAHADTPPPADTPPAPIPPATSAPPTPTAPTAPATPTPETTLPTTLPAGPALDAAAPADPVAGSVTEAKPLANPSDQSVGANVGVATGGRVTPGGLRVTGHYLYQLSSQDWFDGTAVFTFGSGEPACFRDRMDLVVCQHGVTDGGAIELAAGVRRMFAGQGAFLPFARAAIGISYVRFAKDDVSGLAIPLHLGGGIRARVAPAVAVVGLAELTLGLGSFGRGLGLEPQLGLAVTAGAEFQLR